MTQKTQERTEVSLIEYATLKELQFSDYEITRELNISKESLETLKEEWESLGVTDAKGNVLSKTIHALTLGKYEKFARSGMNLKQIAECAGLSLETVRTYIKTWQEYGLVLKNGDPISLSVKEVDNIEKVRSDNKKYLSKIHKELDKAESDKRTLEKEYAKLSKSFASLSEKYEKMKRENSILRKEKEEYQGIAESLVEHDDGYERAILKSLQATIFYGESNFKYAAKLGLAEIREILEEVYPYEWEGVNDHDNS